VSAESILAGKCRHLIPIEQRCSRCVHEAEGDVLLAQLSPLARRKSANQKTAPVPLHLLQNLVQWLSEVPR